MAIVAKLHLRVGADLVAEPFAADAALAGVVAAARRDDALDGALDLVDTDQPTKPLCRAEYWDRLDGLLLAWIAVVETLGAGADQGVIVFPDTRIEATLTRDGDRVHVRYEDVDVTVALDALATALSDAAARLVGIVGAETSALRSLQLRSSGRPSAASPQPSESI
jgi:hypothetical protein